MATDSDRLLGAGKTVVFIDGSTHTLRFGFRALKILEDDFGSVSGVGAALSNNAVFGTIARVMAAGLAHEHLSFDDLLDRLDPQRLADYTQSSIDALTEALPQVAVDPTQKTPSQQVTTVFPGLTSTTPLPFGLVAATTSSGE